MSLCLSVPARHPDSPMVVHLLSEYAAWWRLDLRIRHDGPADTWLLQSSSGGATIRIPLRSADRIPAHCTTRLLHVGGMPIQLPCPVAGHLPDFSYPCDLFNFLAGQLWRAEEQLPALRTASMHGMSHGFLGDRYHFFDRPIVDLWMRGLFEQCLGGALLEPAPAYWLTFDIDCLQKWKTRTRIHHYARFPVAVLRRQFGTWNRQLQELRRTQRPQDDPWYQVPQILQRLEDRRATFFWLGHPRDQQSYRYDIRRFEFASLLDTTLRQGHNAGLHGSPLHAASPEGLGREARRLQSLSVAPIVHSRQHYLRIDPHETLHALDRLGFRMDSTMGFNDRAGFRCGSCIPIRWWDFHRNQALTLTELPFSVGDFNLHNPASFDAMRSRSAIRTQAGWTLLAGGIMTLLFHELYFWNGDYPGHGAFFSSVLHDLEELGLRSIQP